MATKRISMRKIREILRLSWGEGFSLRDVGMSTSISPATVHDYLLRAKLAGLSWPLPEGMSDTELDNLMFASVPSGGPQRPLPDWAMVHGELRRKGVTLALLWEEYKLESPEGFQYSHFCDLYRAWRQKLNLSMRQEHKAGEKLFVDYAGQSVPVFDRETGKVRDAQIFVAVLGASNYTYAEATWTQTLPDWIGSHVRAFSFFGGVPRILVPDNLLSGISKACRYEPDVNPTYQDLANHYGLFVIPARSRKARDKAKVEAGVQLVERWILARLRHQSFQGLAELNGFIRELTADLNNRPFKKLPGSRRSMFEAIDQPALKALPVETYEYAEWVKVRVNVDYHVEVDAHYYSVPYRLVGQRMEARVTSSTVECLFKSKRVASHKRSHVQGGHTTLKEHMPPAHREYLEMSPSRLIGCAERIGPWTEKTVRCVLESQAHPEQSYRCCLGIVRLVKHYEQGRVENACKRALAIKSCSYKSIASILKCGLDRRPLPDDRANPRPPISHTNIRGPEYYETSRPYTTKEGEPYANPSYDRAALCPQADGHGP